MKNLEDFIAKDRVQTTNKDMFETTSLFSSALRYRKVQEVVAQFYSVFSAVDLFKTEARPSALPTSCP